MILGGGYGDGYGYGGGGGTIKVRKPGRKS